MAFDDSTLKIGSTWKSAADLSSYQYRVMRQSAADTVTFASTAGEGGVGLLYNSVSAAGLGCAIVTGGVTLAEAGAAFAAGVELTNDSVGRLVAASDDDFVIAYSVRAASAAGEKVPVFVRATGRGKAPLLLTDSGAGITAKTLVKLDSSGEILTATDGDISIGVAPSAITAAATGSVQTEGTTLLTAGETITAGDLVAPFGTTGRAKVATDSDHAVGIALTGAAAASDITVLLLPISRDPSLTLTDSGAGVTEKTFVKLSTAGTMLTATKGDQALGVVTETVGAAATGHVQTRGLATVTAGETIVAGDLVAPFATTGRAGKVDTMGIAMGIAVTGGAAAADISVMLLPIGYPDYLILPAAADYSASEKVLVDIDTSGEAVAVATAGAKFVGALMNQPAAGEDALIRRMGHVAKVYTGAAVSAGDKLASDASGYAVTATTGAFAGAIALEDDGAGGNEIEVLLAKQETQGNYFVISGFWAGTVGSGAAVNVISGYEHPVKFRTRRAFVNCGTTPDAGGGETCTLTIGSAAGDETVTISAVTAEDKTLSQAHAADTDCYLTLQDSGAGSTTADVQITLVCQETE